MKFKIIIFIITVIFSFNIALSEESEYDRQIREIVEIAGIITVGPDKIQVLSKALDSTDYRILTTAIIMINTRGGDVRKELTPKIVSDFKKSDYPTRIWLIRSFISGDLPNEIVEMLREDLQSKEIFKARGALKAINECPTAGRVLRSDLMDIYNKREYDTSVIYYSIKTIGKTASAISNDIDEVPLWEFIQKILADEDPGIRASALAAISDAASVLSKEKKDLSITILSDHFDSKTELEQYVAVISYAKVSGDRTDKVISKLANLFQSEDRSMTMNFFIHFKELGTDAPEVAKKVMDYLGTKVTAEMQSVYEKWINESSKE